MNVLPNEFFMNADLWTAFAGVALTGLALFIALAAFGKNPLHRRWSIVCAAALTAGVTGTLLTAPHPDDVRVRGESVALLLSPFEGAEIKGTLTAGDRVRATKTHGEFAFVKSPGTAGWIRKDAVSRYVGGW